MFKIFSTFFLGSLKLLSLYLLRIVSFLPWNIRYFVIDQISLIAFAICLKKRKSVNKNLQLILGKKPSVYEVIKVFREYGKYWAEFFDIDRLWSDNNKILVNPDFPPKENSFLGLTFHIGNFELFGPALFPSIGANFNVVAERLQPTFLSDYFESHRLRHHITTILHDDKRKLINVLNQGKALGIVCDRVVGGRGIEVRLFGKKVCLPLNVVSIALQKKIPIVVSYCVKEKKDIKVYYHKIPLDWNHDQVISEIISILENAIRKYPYQWHVLSSI